MASWPYNTTTWARLRRLHLSMHPLCEGCAEMYMLTPANTVDHRTPISAGGAPFPCHDGLASYCHSCHSAKTARGEEAGAVHTRKPRKGCNLDGSPLDRKHPWHERQATAKPKKQEAKSLRADAPGPTAPTNFELVSILEGLDDGFDDLWA